jgi:uncharacterized protein YjaZ
MRALPLNYGGDRMEKRLRVISAYKDLGNYIKAVRSCTEPDYRQLWTEYVIGPRWKEWAAGQFNEEMIRTVLDRPLTDTMRLEESVELLKQAQVENLVSKAYNSMDRFMPSADMDTAICILINYKLEKSVRGVVGACAGRNILLQINPFIKDWQQYIPWVIARQYHHRLWNYEYFFIKGISSVDLLTAILKEGQADYFAKYVCPTLEPEWIRALTKEEEKRQWDIIREYLDKPCLSQRYIGFFFGDKAANTPPYTGYTIGFNIIQNYMRNNPIIGFMELLEKSAAEILEGSGYEESI